MNQAFILPKTDRGAVMDRILQYLMALPLNSTWRVEVEQAKSERSDEQNAYYWSVPIKMLSDFTGYEPQEVHEFMLGSHFGWKDKRVPKTPRNPRGIVSVPVRTTTTDERGRRSKLGKMAFSEYVAFIQRFGAEKCGLMIPDPDKNYAERRDLAA